MSRSQVTLHAVLSTRLPDAAAKAEATAHLQQIQAQCAVLEATIKCAPLSDEEQAQKQKAAKERAASARVKKHAAAAAATARDAKGGGAGPADLKAAPAKQSHKASKEGAEHVTAAAPA